jgi:hypothetical protein
LRFCEQIHAFKISKLSREGGSFTKEQRQSYFDLSLGDVAASKPSREQITYEGATSSLFL